jgi:hypothetical protein
MNGKWNNEFGEVNLIKEIKLRSWLKASFYDTKFSFSVKKNLIQLFQ